MVASVRRLTICSHGEVPPCVVDDPQRCGYTPDHRPPERGCRGPSDAREAAVRRNWGL